MLTLNKDSEVVLHLGGKRKVIGHLMENTLFVKKSSDRHLFMADNSIGFNYELIKTCKLFDTVCLNLDFKEHWTTREQILKEGKVRKFNGNELQIFFPLDSFQSERQTTKPNESNQSNENENETT